MANVSLKADFKDGDKLFAQQLNNNFNAIMAALAAMNKIVWQDDPDDTVVTFRGTTEEINNRDIIDGQLLYDTSTGETYIDYGSQRISTGSGNAIFIGENEPTNAATQLWIDPTEMLNVIGSEVVNSLEGDEPNRAPSVLAVNNALDTITEIETETVSSCVFYKIGKLVVVSGWFVLNDSSGTFSAPYKPTTRVWAATNGVTNADNPQTTGFIDVQTNGGINIKMTGTVTYCTAGFCYLTND